MLLAVPEGFPTDYYTGISLILWIVAICLFLLGFVLFIIKGQQAEMKTQKWLYRAYGLASLGLGLTRIVFILAVYLPEQYDFYTTLGYLTSLSGIIFWLYVMETYLVPKTKRIFTIISLISFTFSVVALIGPLPREIALNIQYILLPFSLGAIAMLYIYLIIKTTGEVRTKAVWILIGLVLIATSQILDGEAFITSYPTFPLVIPPLIMIAGIFLYTFSQLKSSKS